MATINEISALLWVVLVGIVLPGGIILFLMALVVLAGREWISEKKRQEVRREKPCRETGVYRPDGPGKTVNPPKKL